MKPFYLLLSFIILSNLSCNRSEINSCESLNSYFSKSEIKQLSKLENEFEVSLCKIVSSSNNCYGLFFKMVSQDKKTKLNLLEIDQKIALNLEPDLRKKIWFGSKGWSDKEKYTGEVGLDNRSVFFRFLKKMSTSSPGIAEFALSYELTGEGISISSAKLEKNNYGLDTSDDCTQLFLAISYLTIIQNRNSMGNI